MKNDQSGQEKWEKERKKNQQEHTEKKNGNQ